MLAGENRVLMAPLLADPGTRYEYGINTDWLGKVVEAASGSTLDAYVAEHITGPLGRDRDGVPDGRAPARRTPTPVHLKGEDGAWERLRHRPAPGPGVLGRRSRPALHAARLLEVPAHAARRRHLARRRAPSSLRQHRPTRAFRNQIGDIDFPPAISTADPGVQACDFNAGPGWKWGYGLLLNTDDLPGMRRAYSGAWAGLLNTHFWVDRTTGVTGAIYTQFLPFVTPEAFGMYQDFERALYASLG